MAVYYWLPCEDKTLEGWAANRCSQRRARFLPGVAKTGDYPKSISFGHAKWEEIQAESELIICCHGCATSLSEVGWKTPNGVLKWSAEKLAEALVENFSGADVANNFQINFHLTACWGANQFTCFCPSFGKRFADELSAEGFTGTLTAYKGSGAMNPYGEYQIGSSRFTSGLLHWKKTTADTVEEMAAKGTRNRFGVQVAHKSEDAAVTWTL